MRESLGISTAANIGIHALVFLAARGPSAPCSTSSIAGALDVSESHLGKVLGTLCKQGFLQSNRGPNGGFGLVNTTREASVLSVLEAIDGPYDTPTCRVRQPACSEGGCSLLRVASEVHKLVLKELGALSIGTMAGGCIDLRAAAIACTGEVHG